MDVLEQAPPASTTPRPASTWLIAGLTVQLSGKHNGGDVVAN